MQKFKNISCSLKTIIETTRPDDKYVKKKSKAWSEEVIDTLINCFRQMNAYGILSVVIIKAKAKSFWI